MSEGGRSVFEPYRECSAVGLVARLGDATQLRHLLQSGAPLDARDGRGWTPLHEASFSGSALCVQELLQYDALTNDPKLDENEGAYDGTTALLLACSRGHDDVVKVLLDHGADPDKGSLDEMRPIVAAVNRWMKSEAIVKMLLEAGAEPNSSSWNGWTALHEAARIGHADLVRTLLDAGADCWCADSDRLTPLFIAAQYNRLACLDIFINYVGNKSQELVNVCASDGTSPAYMAVHEGYDVCLRRLLEEGADVDQLTGEGVHVVVPAARHNFWRCLQLLLARCPGAIAQSKEDPVFVAAEEKSLECLELLVGYGAPADRSSDFFMQFQMNSYPFLNALLSKRLATPLCRAVSRGFVPGAELLLDRAHASALPKTRNSHSPFLLAILKRNEPGLLAAFLQRNVDVNYRSEDSFFPVPDALLLCIHPLYREQLVCLLRAGLEPMFEQWCRCLRPDDVRGSLLTELMRLWTPDELTELLSIVAPFSIGLPMCCPQWATAVPDCARLDIQRVNGGCPPLLSHLTRLAIRARISVSDLHRGGWAVQVGLPNFLVHYVDFTSV